MRPVCVPRSYWAAAADSAFAAFGSLAPPQAASINASPQAARVLSIMVKFPKAVRSGVQPRPEGCGSGRPRRAGARPVRTGCVAPGGAYRPRRDQKIERAPGGERVGQYV